MTSAPQVLISNEAESEAEERRLTEAEQHKSPSNYLYFDPIGLFHEEENRLFDDLGWIEPTSLEIHSEIGKNDQEPLISLPNITAVSTDPTPTSPNSERFDEKIQVDWSPTQKSRTVSSEEIDPKQAAEAEAAEDKSKAVVSTTQDKPVQQ